MVRSTLWMCRGVVSCLFLFTAVPGFCAVVPGDVIDATTWAKAVGLVPDEIIGWIQKGEFVLEVGDLPYSPSDCLPPYALQAREDNKGRYTVDENDFIVEKDTGTPVQRLIGHPFPEVDLGDPKACQKIVYNCFYTVHANGDFIAYLNTDYIRKSGYERSTKGEMRNLAMVGNPDAVKRENPDNLEKYTLFVAKSPYDIAGAAIMTWRYLDPRKQDTTFAYIPAIRRVRRMSAGNRSDAMFGSDAAVDDAGGFDGKVTSMEWKLLGRQEALIPFASVHLARLVKSREGGWRSPGDVSVMVYGYQKDGWNGAAWAPVNWVWVKKPVVILEAKAKDPYYNYGIQRLWVQTETWGVAYKTIYDKAGKYWKTFLAQPRYFESEDGAFRMAHAGDQVVIDERSNHATVFRGPMPTDVWKYFVEMDVNDFSLAGFQKFCK